MARDQQGVIVAAASFTIDSCWYAEDAEAQAICAGLQVGVDYNLNPTAILSDCSNAVAAAKEAETNTSRSWSTYKNIAVLKSCFPGCEFVKIRRNCNSIAHKLANLAQRSRESNVWLLPLPDFIYALCIPDPDSTLSMNE